MKELLSLVGVAVGFALCIIAALATPIAIVYGLHEWVIVDVQFKYALWEACKIWLSMLAMVIPGGLLVVLSK